MAVFGEHVAVARGLATALWLLTVLSLYFAAVRLLGARRAAGFGLLLLAFKWIAWPSFTAYYYWDVAFAFGCAGSALLLGHRFAGPDARLLASGLCVGLAIVAKQSLGLPLLAAGCAVVALPGWLQGRAAPGRARELLTFAGAGLLPGVLMGLYFATHGLLGAMLESGLLRPFTAYLPSSSTSFFEPLAWWRLGELQELQGLAYWSEPLWSLLTAERLPGRGLYPVYWTAGEVLWRLLYTSLPVAFGWAGLRFLGVLRAGAPEPGDRALFAFAPLAAAITLSAFPRADFTHVVSIYPVVLLVLLACLRPGRRGLALERAAIAAVLAACLAFSVFQHRQLDYRLRGDRVDLWITPDKSWIAEVLAELERELAPGDPLFVYGHEAFYYFLTDHYSPWPFSQLYVGQAGRDRGRALAGLLAADPPPIVVRGAIRFPRVPPLPRYAPELHRHIERSYAPDPGFFERHPPVGERTPPPRQFMLLRPRYPQGGAR